jgi:hypothetical protein
MGKSSPWKKSKRDHQVRYSHGVPSSTSPSRGRGVVSKGDAGTVAGWSDIHLPSGRHLNVRRVMVPPCHGKGESDAMRFDSILPPDMQEDLAYAPSARRRGTCSTHGNETHVAAPPSLLLDEEWDYSEAPVVKKETK